MTFLTQATFQKEIENITRTRRVSYLDAVLIYCKENDLDPEDVKSLVSSNLKDKIKVDAMNDGLIKKEARLPI